MLVRPPSTFPRPRPTGGRTPPSLRRKPPTGAALTNQPYTAPARARPLHRYSTATSLSPTERRPHRLATAPFFHPPPMHHPSQFRSYDRPSLPPPSWPTSRALPSPSSVATHHHSGCAPPSSSSAAAHRHSRHACHRAGRSHPPLPPSGTSPNQLTARQRPRPLPTPDQAPASAPSFSMICPLSYRRIPASATLTAIEHGPSNTPSSTPADIHAHPLTHPTITSFAHHKIVSRTPPTLLPPSIHSLDVTI